MIIVTDIVGKIIHIGERVTVSLDRLTVWILKLIAAGLYYYSSAPANESACVRLKRSVVVFDKETFEPGTGIITRYLYD